jgi:amino acid adenylation domain-containing protein
MSEPLLDASDMAEHGGAGDDRTGFEVAVVGMAGRFPGADDLRAFWRNLRGGVECIRFFTRDELLEAGTPAALADHPDFVPAMGELRGAAELDAALFGLTPRDAEIVDPQHRLLLECAWSALEHAGYDPARIGRPVGVFAGSANSSYQRHLLASRELVEAVGRRRIVMWNEKDQLAAGVAYRLDLRGPALSIQTACSTSLVAIHLACQSLVTGECDVALAGGVSLQSLRTGHVYTPDGIGSPDGHCRAFDANGGGTVGGAGVGLVVLRRLDDALADGDTIHAVVRGSAINNDGAEKVGYTAPSVGGQARVISEALSVARVDAASLQYVEGHGSGTALGDAVELKALGEVLSRSDAAGHELAIGSVKSNLGHLDTAAGVAGFIKTVLALAHREIPPSLNCRQPHPGVEALGGRVFVNTELRPWARNGTPRRAGVSSFGIGGTNAHVVLEEAPPREPSGPSRPLHVLPLSAKTATALAASAENLAAFLESESPSLADAAFTLQTGRRELEHRLAVVCRDIEEAVSALREAAARAMSPIPRTERPVAFLFPGLGMHHVGMARGLYGAEPVFRDAVDACCERLISLLGTDLREILWPSPVSPSPEPREQGDERKQAGGWDLRAMLGRAREASPLDETRVAHPAVFVIEYALAKLWTSWGVKPAALLGHSLGEYVAACVAGVLSVDDALALVALRARLVDALAAGAMTAVPLGEAALREILPPSLDVAAVNTPGSCVVSGPEDEIAAFEAALAERGTASRRLAARHAFHSRAMEPIAAELERAIAGFTLRAPEIPFVSNVTGTWISDDQARTPAYWARHLTHTVRFADGVATLRQEPRWALLEVGPGQTLGAWALQHPADGEPEDRAVFSSLRHEHNRVDDLRFVLESLGGLWAAGVSVDWSAFSTGERRHRIPLPGYPFERRRYWVPPPPEEGERPKQGRDGEESAHASQKGPQAMETELSANGNGTATGARRKAILAGLLEIASELTGIAPERIETDADLFRVGFDSLLLLQGVQSIEKRLGVRLSLIEVLEELTTLDAIARHLDAVLPPDAVVRNAPPAAEPAPAAALPQAIPAPPAFFPPAAHLPLPSLPAGAGADAGVLQQVVAQQLQAMTSLMAQQLAIVAGAAAAPVAITAAPAADVHPSPNGHGNGNGHGEGTAAIATTLVATPAAVEQSPRAKIQPQAPYVAYQPLNTEAGGVTAEEKAYLDDFTARYVAKTGGSKAHQARYHAALADSRVTARFRRAWKELTYPIAGRRAAGSRVWDVDGNEYVDTGMAFGCCLFGHAPDFITRALHGAIDNGYGLGPQSPDAGRAAELVCEIGGNERAVFCNSGTEAVMGAIRAARTHTGRQKVVYFAGGYHGWSDIVQGRAHPSRDGRARPTAPGISPHALEDVLLLEYDHPASLERLAKELDQVATVIVEPVQSRRPDIQPRAFLHELRRMTREAGAMLHFDELITGFRIQPGGAQAFFGVDADLVTYGKIVAGGLPMGVVAGKAGPMSVFDGGLWSYGDDSFPTAQRTLFAGAFFKHPLSMAVACAVMEEIRRQGAPMYERLNARAERLVGRLNEFFEAERYPVATERFGSMFRFFFAPEVRFPDLFSQHMILEGVHVIPETQTHFISTAHTDDDLETVFQAVVASARAMRRGGFIPPAPGGVSATSPAAADGKAHAVPAAASAGDTARGDGVRVLPVTEAQRQLWIASQLGDDANQAYVESAAIRLHGALDEAALRGALQDLVDRHDALRTTFSPDGDAQLVHATWKVDLPPAVDFRGVPADGREDEVEAWVRRTVERPFDLARGPLARFALAVVGDREHLLLFDTHHTVLDGWSFSTLFADLGAFYAARREGRAADLAPRPDHGELVRAHIAALGEDEAARAYWDAQFAGGVPVLELPTDRPRPRTRTFRGGRAIRTAGDALWRRLGDAGRAHGLTLFHSFLAAYAVWLGRLTGQDDVVVGTPSAGQGRASAALVGNGLSILPIRVRLDGAARFADVARAVRRSVVGALEHQNFSLTALVDRLLPTRDPGRPPLFSAALFVDRGGGETWLGDLRAEIDARVGGARVELGMGIVEMPDALRLELSYAADLFDRETVDHWLALFERLLEEVADGIETPLAALDPMAGDEGRRVVADWNRTDTPVAAGHAHQRVEAHAAAAPDAVAVEADDGVLTYGELNARANRLAHHLASLGGGPEVRVALCLERGAALVTAMLATLKAGGAYVPLDPAYPAGRRAWMLADSGAALLVTRGSLWEGDVPAGVTVVSLDADAEAIAARPDANPGVETGERNLAYVIYTSGSTGTPKGAGVEHGSLSTLCAAYARDLAITADARASQLVSGGFDAAVLEVWPFLAQGARVQVVADALRLDTAALQRWLVARGTTHAHVPPPIAEPLLERAWPRETALRVMCTGGARMRVGPGPDAPFELVVSYGVTECTVASTSTRVRTGEPLSSIGRPGDNSRVYVLDAAGRPAPAGVPGELYLGGVQVARGYLGRPALTAERFVPDPFSRDAGARLYRTGDRARWRADGTLEFIGRLDGQVKIRGFRVEPGEIEVALRAHPAVADCAVVAREDGQGELRLVAWVVGDAAVAELRAHLRRSLPEHMVPAAFVPLSALPMNANGKVDRAALPAPDFSASAPAWAAPATELEETLAGLWREILGVDRVGRHDAFFELGGHSLKVGQLHARLRDALGRDVPVTDLFRFPTVASLAEHLAAEPGDERRAGVGKERASKRRVLAGSRAGEGGGR